MHTFDFPNECLKIKYLLTDAKKMIITFYNIATTICGIKQSAGVWCVETIVF